MVSCHLAAHLADRGHLSDQISILGSLDGLICEIHEQCVEQGRRQRDQLRGRLPEQLDSQLPDSFLAPGCVSRLSGR